MHDMLGQGDHNHQYS